MTVNEIIRNALGTGEENAVSLAELEDLTELTTRDVHHCIEDMRLNGAVICSSNNGYFYPATEDELRKYVRKEHARAATIIRNTRAAAVELCKWGGDSNG